MPSVLWSFPEDHRSISRNILWNRYLRTAHQNSFALLQARVLELLDLIYTDKNSEEIEEYLEQKFTN